MWPLSPEETYCAFLFAVWIGVGLLMCGLADRYLRRDVRLYGPRHGDARE